MSYLETSPELAATLQKAQTAWVQFRNCAYLRPIATDYADDCLIRNGSAAVGEALLLSDFQEIEQG